MLNTANVRMCTEVLGMSDKQIAAAYGVNRDTVTHFRNNHGIKKDKHPTIQQARTIFCALAQKHELVVIDMKETDPLHSFDVLIGTTRIAIKSAKESTDGHCSFCFTDPPSNGNKEGDARIQLPNGKMRKLYSKTCDVVVLVCVSSPADVYIIPSRVIPDTVQSIKIQPGSRYNKYSAYRNRWDLLGG